MMSSLRVKNWDRCPADASPRLTRKFPRSSRSKVCKGKSSAFEGLVVIASTRPGCAAERRAPAGAPVRRSRWFEPPPLRRAGERRAPVGPARGGDSRALGYGAVTAALSGYRSDRDGLLVTLVPLREV